MNDWKTIVLSMRDNAQEKGITHQEIADKAGMKRENVTLLFGLKRPPTLTTLCRVADAMDGSGELGGVIERRYQPLFDAVYAEIDKRGLYVND